MWEINGSNTASTQESGVHVLVVDIIILDLVDLLFVFFSFQLWFDYVEATHTLAENPEGKVLRGRLTDI